MYMEKPDCEIVIQRRITNEINRKRLVIHGRKSTKDITYTGFN